MTQVVSYIDLLPKISQSWEFVESASQQRSVVIDCKVTDVPQERREASLQVYFQGSNHLFWFPDWLANNDGLFFTQSQLGALHSAITPPLQLTFNSHQNATERIFAGPAGGELDQDGRNKYYRGEVALNEWKCLNPNDPTPGPWEWKLKINVRGPASQRTVCEVYIRLQAGFGILEYASTFGSPLILRRPWLDPPHQPPAGDKPVRRPTHPAKHPHNPSAPPPKPGDPLYALWEAQFYVNGLDGENHWRIANKQDPRIPYSYEQKSQDFVRDYKKHLAGEGPMPEIPNFLREH